MIRSQKVLPRLARQIAEEGDEINDLTVAWPKSRKVVDLGVLTLDRIIEDGVVHARAN